MPSVAPSFLVSRIAPEAGKERSCQSFSASHIGPRADCPFHRPAFFRLVQSLNSLFFPLHIGAEPGRAKEESRITCMRMLRTPPFFPPKSGEKPYLEVLSRFGLWRDFLNDNIQATISAFRLIKNMSSNPRSVEFHQCHAKPHSICLFFYHIIKDNERNLCQDLLTIENTDSDLKVHALHYANELLVRVRLSF